MFDTVLIANRGEIACRIIATLQRLGIRSVAVYSDADAGARHVALADVSIRIGPAPAAQSYLSIDAVIAAARETGAQAIHPGYGFLAENADFAQACADAGIVFIGPTPEAIRTMGDKITAKNTVAARDVPTVPGVARDGLTDAALIDAAPGIGFPLLIKPSAGGGGKGMHVVSEEAELASAIAAARREAQASFGDDSLFLERYLTTPRHIEVQVLADRHGNVIHLGERECSLQRRHQKVIEEAPSPLLDEATRARIGEAACETARSVAYEGAGTVEFIVEATRPDEFFFMEMNTRLQVEHPVTEQVTGIDLVEQQLRIAAGEVLAITQSDIVLTGHSIEARVYAEDPSAGFLPTGGHVDLVTHPSGPGIRVDTAIDSGLDVSIDYDPMLAKVIAWGSTRDEARRRLVRALDETAVFGFPVNVEFMRRLLELPEVVDGDLDTGLIARRLDDIAFAEADERVFAEAALLLDFSTRPGTDPWRRRDGWRLGDAAARRYALHSGAQRRVVLVSGSDGVLSVRVSGGTAHDSKEIAGNEGSASGIRSFESRDLLRNARPAYVRPRGDHRYTLDIGGEARTISALTSAGRVSVAHGGAVFDVMVERLAAGAGDDAASVPQLDSPMPGTVVLVSVEDGAHVEEGDPVVVVEAMKMEHVLRAGVSGTVSLRAAQGDTVARGQTLAVITPSASADSGENLDEKEQR
ncbi:acetyl-CoA carboxylase biotin carboxylase subunit [Microbacterium aurantiacum]|uniref:acetyl-CoA carboxylase biotin carboxylase subunit n=1 Tax=Microbacterium aurantiacum TaxID=162393 RepID=UPI000C80665F|nr:acetyl/propionyl/methylcrotonyl-CoA carboxylase subunit alpha [Microbacterium aurantiacum]